MKLHLPSGLQRGLAFLIQDDWTPAQACAVVELLDDLREVIYNHYLLQIQHPDGHSKCSTCGQSNCSTLATAFDALSMA